LASNVDDERDARADFGDVGEILFRTDADVSSALYAQLSKFINDVQVGGLIGCEIIRHEISAFFGKFADHARKFRSRNAVERTLFRGGRCLRKSRGGGEDEREE